MYVIKLFMKFQDFKPHYINLTGALQITTLTVTKIIHSWCKMNKWVWSIGRIILIGKNQNTHRKPGPLPLCPPQIPYGLDYKWTRASVVRGPGLTVRAIYLRWEKWPTNAFYCIDQSRCVVLHVVCVPNKGCVLFERLCNTNWQTALLSEVGYVCQISHPIFGLFSLLSSIHHCWLRNSLKQSVLMATGDDSKTPSCTFSALN